MSMPESEGARRLGYYLARPDDKYDFKVLATPATDEVLAELHTIIDVVFFLQPIAIALAALQRNQGELTQFVVSHPEKLAASKESFVATVEVLDGMVEASRLAGNFLSAATALLSLIEAALRRAYGKDSAQLTAWNSERRERHAVSFAYRFLYELRNFSQHRGLPISSFHVSGNRANDDAPMTYATSLRLQRDKLLVDGFDWGNLRLELERRAAEFELLPLVDEYAGIVESLTLDVFMMEGARLANCVRYMEAVKATLQLPVGAVPALFVGEVKAPDITPTGVEIIPMEQLRWIMQRWDALLNRVHPPSVREPR